ncbi:MAG: hypothetical protein KatS3mg004_0423 [Bryobacteraceae bacterium]|nr:MAG: hypothetical protein KatS3mg004_0423 [Bryobacteraceae bacterium]
MTRILHILTVCVTLAGLAAASMPGPGSPSTIRPGRPPDPLGAWIEPALRMMDSAPGGLRKIPSTTLQPAEDICK